ncbi:MAG TPA: UbiD family decarboxylase [Candidatus Binataceae bacterium]|nr:UbiD family decarboxylase [Candidatus Binataceae bacterium]
MDLRSCLAAMIDHGLAVQIDDPIDWDVEVGAIMRYANEHGSPAQWFTNMKDAMKGATLLGGLFATYERIAVIMGMSRRTSYHELVDFCSERFAQRIKPIIVDSGPCQQNVMMGDDIDLLKFPVPKFHPQDGGRYIGTLNVGVCQDPDTGWVNWGTYRSMLHDRRTAGLWLGALNHGGMIFKKYRERGKPMEYAQFYGSDPLCNIVASSGIPYGVPEAEVVGGIRGEPVKLVKCKTVDLYVPADAEIVMEGTIHPDELRDEGPFGEYPGYVISGVVKRPVFRLSAVTHRDDPILPGTCLGIPTDDEIPFGLYLAATLKEQLRNKGIPVAQVAVPVDAGWHAVVVSMHKAPYAGIPQQIASTVWTDRVGLYFPYVIVVDDDIDPANVNQVFHALFTKCNPVRGINVYPGYMNSPLTPYLPKSPWKELGFGAGNCLLDCTWPIDWSSEDIPERVAFDTMYPQGMRAKVLANVKKWGL